MAAFPDVVKSMTQNIQWTTDLGNAFLAQESGVMDAVNAANEPVSQKGILHALRGLPLEPKMMCDRLVRAVKQHSAGQPQADDITLVSLGRV